MFICETAAAESQKRKRRWKLTSSRDGCGSEVDDVKETRNLICIPVMLKSCSLFLSAFTKIVGEKY